MPLFIGIDLGTSGCRAIAIDEQKRTQAEEFVDLPSPTHRFNQVEQDPQIWWDGVQSILSKITGRVSPKEVKAIAVDGTSGSLLITDQRNIPLTPALMYNDARAQSQAKRIQYIAPKSSVAQGATSALAKLLWLKEHGYLPQHGKALHQADWVSAQLSGDIHYSDINNCLKMGFDPQTHKWPDWIRQLGIDISLLPKVVQPGTPIGVIKPELCRQFGFEPYTQIMAGTTDSTAAFIASGASHIGEAVTSLGSTLVLKILSEIPVSAPQYGVYSQPMLDKWLVGGASNSGGAVLLDYFTAEQMRQMTTDLKPEVPTSLNYYPLSHCGERFPVNNPKLQPKLAPRPNNQVKFFQGMLEGIAHIEKQGYDLLHRLGAPNPCKIFTSGGGAINDAWRRIREQLLNVTVTKAKHTQAAYGTALIALRANQEQQTK